MTFAQNIAAIAVLLAWLPATNHCLIGAVMPNAESGGCCAESNERPHQDIPCDSCAMCSLESGDILPYTPDFFAGNFNDFLLWEKLSLSGPLGSFKIIGFGLGMAPPDLASWHFNVRNALPGRSPSIILL